MTLSSDLQASPIQAVIDISTSLKLSTNEFQQLHNVNSRWKNYDIASLNDKR
jgi:hypothetical protein